MDEILRSLGIPASTIGAFHLDTLARLLLAVVLGGAVGMERELSAKPAGLRTNILICLGAALLTELSIDLAALAVSDAGGVRGDPARLAAQIIPGIGFIGAGAILHGKGRVTGLTTAATLWIVTAIGIAVGTGRYVEAIGTTVLVLGTLLVLGKIESRLIRSHRHRRYVAVVEPSVAAITAVERAFADCGLRVERDSVEKGKTGYEVHFKVTGRRECHEQAMQRLVADPGVQRLSRG